MALIKADRVKESSTSTGASTFLLNGAFTGFRSFSSVCSVGDTFYYVIDSDLGSEWETGLGTYSAANTLTRTTVHSSSNGGSIVTFSAGTKNVYISLTGNQLGTLATLTGSEVLTNKTINASNNTITNVSLTTGVTGTLPIANGGTGTTTAQLAINALAGAVTSGSYLRGNGTNVVMATIAAGDVPTLNQNTTGTASGSVSGTASYLAKFTSTNVVGNSLISDNGTNILVGTQNPTYLGRFNITSSVQASTTTGIVLQNFSSLGLIGLDLFNDGNKEAFIGIGGSGYAAPYGDNVVCMAYGSVNLIFGTVGAERMRINSQGNVGIGTTSPSGKLHVRSSAPSNWIVYLQNSAGTYAGGIYQSSTNNTGLYLADSAGADKVQLIAQSSTNSFIATGANFGIGTTTPTSGFHVANLVSTFESSVAANKVVIVKGAAAQSANLLELQNSSGTALAYVNSAGDIVGAGGAISTGTGNGTDGYGESGPVVLVNKWLAYNTGSIYNNIRKLYGSRVFPATNANGDYVEIAKIARSGFHPITLTIHASHGGASGAGSKVYVITPDYNFGNWTAAPLSAGKAGDFDFDVELVAPDPYWLAVRARRHSSSTLAGAALMFTIECHNYNRGGMVELSGTGNSASALPYRSDYQRIGPTVSAPPPAGGSGAGTSLSISAANAVTTGAGGGITLQAGNAAGTGAGGNIILQSGSYATSGVGGGIALKPTASSAGQYSSSVQFGYLGRYTPSHYTFERMLPNTVGDYVELFSFNAADSSWVEFNVLIWKHAEAYGSKSYKISGSYMQSSGLIQPVGNGIENRGYAGFFNNIFEVELAYPDSSPGTIRLRRTAAGGTNVYAYVYVRAQTTGLIEKSGTGTSSFGLTNPNSTHLTFPTLITPMPVPGGNGSGFSMTLKARDAAGTGDGGNILLQAGAFSTSGSNGKVIVRGLASNTANLQEWQNNAGSVLSAVKSDGSIQPASLADSAATNNSIYYSTTASKLVYKDAAGTVNNLY